MSSLCIEEIAMFVLSHHADVMTPDSEISPDTFTHKIVQCRIKTFHEDKWIVKVMQTYEIDHQCLHRISMSWNNFVTKQSVASFSYPSNNNWWNCNYVSQCAIMTSLCKTYFVTERSGFFKKHWPELFACHIFQKLNLCSWMLALQC